MLGFSPLAAAPLADDGVVLDDGGIVAVDIQGGVPVVDALPLTQNHVLGCDSINATPVVDNANLDAIISNFEVNSVLSGAPKVDALQVTLNYNFATSDLLAQPVLVDAATATINNVIRPIEIGRSVTEYAVTVASGGSGNVFYLDAVSNPALSFIRGNTYVFDVSDGTNSGHPFKFTLTDGTDYTDGVTRIGTEANADAKIIFKVPLDAPSSLLYICEVHGSGMGNTVSVSSQALPQQPSVDTATVAVISNFFPIALEPQPVVDALPFFQEYALTMVEITAGVPTLPARFTWDYQEPPTDSWTDQADDDSVWTTQADSSDTWTEATEPTDIWTDVTDPTDTWSEAA
jgi:hypothetical protein